MGGKKRQSAVGGLGNALNNARDKAVRRHRVARSDRHSSALEDAEKNVTSVTAESALDEFLATADLAGTEFTAERMNLKIINPMQWKAPNENKELALQQQQQDYADNLKIPRRPGWDDDTSPAELDKLERESFLEWRRAMSQLQEVEGFVFTPYERNLELWRQLWRVVERSDVVVQIVDARNPLLFRCEDLENYVLEVDPLKQNVLLVNKADLLSEEQRAVWAKFFDRQHCKVAFWSALDEPLPEVAEASEEKEGSVSQIDTAKPSPIDGRLPPVSASVEKEKEQNKAKNEPKKEENEPNEEEDLEDSEEDWETDSDQSGEEENKTEWEPNSSKLMTPDQLIEYFRSCGREKEGPLTVGLVGYPNVGKSSTINKLLGHKRVPVSATPGKTKHFQTHFLDPSADHPLVLCDCPGLVMPSIALSSAQMLTLGILPIDNMRSYFEPVALVCAHIDRRTWEESYGVMLPRPGEEEPPDRPPTPHELLTSVAFVRGFMGSKGVPDNSRAARLILKDYMNGRLRYCYPPPGYSEERFRQVTTGKEPKTLAPSRPASSAVSLAELERRNLLIGRPHSSQIDSSFFQVGHTSGAHSKIASAQPSVKSVEPTSGRDSVSSAQSISDKPWKRHGNKNKREKLRRLYKHLDA